MNNIVRIIKLNNININNKMINIIKINNTFSTPITFNTFSTTASRMIANFK